MYLVCRSFKFCSLALLTLLLLSGCISFTALRNTQFESDLLPPDGVSYRTVNICRPSSIYKGLEYVGVFVDDKPVAELGSSNKLQINVPSQPLKLTFMTPWTITSRSVDVVSPIPAGGDVFIIFTVASGDDSTVTYDPVLNANVYKETSKWIARGVTSQEFENRCSKYKPEIKTDKKLFGTTLSGQSNWVSLGEEVAPLPTPERPNQIQNNKSETVQSGKSCPSIVTLNIVSSNYSGIINIEFRQGKRPGSKKLQVSKINTSGQVKISNVCAGTYFFSFSTPDSPSVSVTQYFDVLNNGVQFSSPSITVTYTRAKTHNAVQTVSRGSL